MLVFSNRPRASRDYYLNCIPLGPNTITNLPVIKSNNNKNKNNNKVPAFHECRVVN